MSSSRRLAIAIGAWMMCCDASAAGQATLNACAGNASWKAQGIDTLEAQCPGLAAALDELGISASLPEGWRDTLNLNALRDLATLAHRYADAPAPATADPAALHRVLEQMAGERVKPEKSWWDAVNEWLRSLFSNQDAESATWLDRLLQRFTPSTDLLKVITYALLALTVLTAVMFVVNELRVAGVLSRRKRVTSPVAGVSVPWSNQAGTPGTELDTAPLRDQPGILLRQIVARLLTNGQLRTERSLTHRELVTHSAFSDPDSRASFSRVSTLAERELYGLADADVASIQAVIAEGRNLLSNLPLSVSAQR